jgi:hypothetical protein
MFLFSLAENVFHCSVGELAERLTVEEYIYWQAYMILKVEELEHRSKHGGAG